MCASQNDSCNANQTRVRVLGSALTKPSEMAHRTKAMVSRRMEWLAVAGAAAQGLLYFAIGFTAIRAAVYVGKTPQNMTGVLKEMAATPIGRATLGLVAAGFIAIASARLLEVRLGQVTHRGHAKAAVVRLWNVVVGFVYAGISVLALRFFFQPSAPGDEKTSEWTALVIAHPVGRWLIGGIGVITAIAGLQQLITALPADDRAKWMRYCALYGRASFAVLLMLIGGSAIVSAVFRSPAEARGIGGALTFLQHQLFGATLLTVTGVGLVVYGLILAVEAFREPSSQLNATL